MNRPSKQRSGWRSVGYGLAVLLLASLVGVAVLAGGGDGPEQPQDLLDAELRGFASARPIRIGWYRDGEPVSIWEGDVVAGGYAVQEWNLLAIKLGFAVEHVPYDEPVDVVAALRDGDIDVAGGLAIRPDLRAFAEPTEPLALERVSFVGRPEQAGGELGTLVGRTATTIPKSPLVAALQSLYPDATYVPSEGIAEGLAATADGRVDLFLAPLGIAGHSIREQGLRLVPIGDAVIDLPVSSWAVADSLALELALAARAQLTDDEISLATLRWTGFDLGPPKTRDNDWIPRLLLVIGGLGLTFTAFLLVLRRRVRAATRALATLNAELEERVAARTEQLDRAVAGLERSNNALSEFAQTVAHDLRGPAGAIYGFAELLLHRDLPDSQRKELLASMASSSRRLVAMVADLLEDAARAGALPARTTGPAFEAWLREVVGPEVREADADLAVVAPSGDVPLEEVVLHRAAINLVGNALKYAGQPDRTLRIEAALREDDEGEWSLTIDDNGPGVPPQLRESVFELGFRGVDDARGHGLGLAETRELVVQAGGTIEVTDSPLGGARFVVELPVMPEAVPA